MAKAGSTWAFIGRSTRPRASTKAGEWRTIFLTTHSYRKVAENPLRIVQGISHHLFDRRKDAAIDERGNLTVGLS
jgi:hypothetical protein